GRLPPFFYLACCHGIDAEEGAVSAAARLHREGVTQVVGYSGPIRDDLSTAAEAALYASLAAGEPTRQAVRHARNALLQTPVDGTVQHRDSAAAGAGGPHPFAWAQLVLYHRGPEFPLGTPAPAGASGEVTAALRRTFHDPQRQRLLRTGFIGRRRELHAAR